MTPGRVITIRINPDDAMSVIDAADLLAIPTPNMSFAQVCKAVFRSLLEDQRVKGRIPRRDGFAYTQMMDRFPKMPKKASRRATIALAASASHPGSYVPPIEPEAPDRRSRRLRYEELRTRREADPLNFTPEENLEFADLLTEFYV